MSIAPVSALAAALGGMQSCMRQMNAAAGTIARAGLPVVPPAGGAASGPATAVPGDLDVAEAMITVRIAQRLFAANAAVVRVADQMAREAVRLGEHD